VNNGNIHNKAPYFSDSVNPGFKSLPNTVNLTQSPFIITLQGNNRDGATYPNAKKANGVVSEFVNLFGHGLSNSTQQVMMVKTSSNLLLKNSSALPQEILSGTGFPVVQDDAAVQGASAQALATLDFFKTGHFLNNFQPFTPKSQLRGYTYRVADGTLVTGEKNKLPQDKLSTVQFTIKTLPAGAYYVVVYDQLTGDYDFAPVPITINIGTGGIQIHDVAPQTAVLQSPSFTVNGFNFPITDDINKGAVFSVSLVDSTLNNTVIAGQTNSPFGSTAFLQIDKTSPSNSKNGNGSITLTSDSQFTANFTALHLTNADLSKLSDTFKLYITVTYQTQNVAAGKVNESALSSVIQIQKQPIIHFLANTDGLSATAAIAYPKSLVHVDQTTGQVIAFGEPENFLYIVGENFTTETVTAPNVLLKGTQQQVLETKSWPSDVSLQAIRVKVDPSNIKRDANVEIKVGSASSEAFQFTTTLGGTDDPFKTASDAKGVHTKGDQTKTNLPFFRDILPYDQFDQHTLLNSSNTKVSSSVQLTLVNTETRQSVDLKADLNSSIALPFLPNQIKIPANTVLASDGTLDVTFYFYNLYNVNISTPKIFRLQHKDGSFGGIFQPNETMKIGRASGRERG